MNPGLGNRKVFRFISYALVFLMLACFVMTLGNLIDILASDWHVGIIAGVLLFIVLDRLYTYRQLKSLTFLSSEWTVALGAQWVLILLITRLLLSYANGLEAFRSDLSLFARGYFADLFTPEFVITILLAFLTWQLPALFLDLLDEIGLDEERALRDESPMIQSDTVPAHQRLVTLILSVGIFLVILTVMTRLNLRTILSNTDGLPSVEISRFSGAEAGALLYFVFGLTLLSLSRLMSLQTHWHRQRIPVSSNHLVRQWGIYSLVFLVTLAFVVSLLPAGDSLGLFPILGTFFGFLLGVLIFLSQLVVALLLYLISLPFLLFGTAPPFIGGVAPPPMPVMPPVGPELPRTPNATWELIRSALLWGLLAIIIIVSILRVVSQHESILAALRRSRFGSWLVLAWQWLSHNVDRTRENLSQAIVDGWQSIVSRLEGQRLLPPISLINPRSLDPRRRIYFFYLAMIRRGAERGVARQPSQTPSEYALQLEKALPSAEDDVHSITEAFVEARYSHREVDAEKADQVKATWGRIRRALQNLSTNERSRKN